MSSLWKNDIKRLREIIILFSGMLGISLVLSLMSLKNEINTILLFLMIMIIVLVIPITNFSYLHDKTKATHMSSLPWTKHGLFILKYSSGLCAILFPVFGYYMAATLLNVYIVPIFPVILLIILYYSVACFVAVITGTVMMHGFLYFIVTLLPMTLYVSLLSLFTVFIHGIENIYFIDTLTSYIVPFVTLWKDCHTGDMTVNTIVIYSIYIVALIVLGILFSYKRNMENTGIGLVFPMLDIIIKSAIIICFSWIITTIAVTRYTSHYIFIIYITITLLLSIVVQLEKTKRINIRFVVIQTIILSAFTTIVFISSRHLLENYVPQDVESAILSIEGNSYAIYDIEPVLDEKGISSIEEIHQYLIDTTNKEIENQMISLKYQLSDGDTVYRDYYVNEAQYEEIVQQIVETDSLYASHYSKYFSILENMKDNNRITFEKADSSMYYGLHTKEDYEIFIKIFEEEVEHYSDNDIIETDGYYINLYKGNRVNGFWINEKGPLINAIEKYILLKNQAN
ncbi:MAG: hypothetical protein ACK5LC_17625 [Coprobacillaceae bacterium]